MPSDATSTPPKTDELGFMHSRLQANHGNPIQIRAQTTALRARAATGRSRGGEDAHEVGTQLAVLYMAFAEHVYEREDFLDYVREDVGIGRTGAFRFMRVARYATAAQARLWGIDACLSAARVVEYLSGDDARWRAAKLRRKPRTISDLAGLALPVDDERQVRFDRDTLEEDDVDAALARLEGAGAGPRKQSAEQRRANEQLGEAVRSRPELSGVEARVGRRRRQEVLTLVIPQGANLVAVAAAIEKALSRR
jgi:hypothetical protein